MTLAFPKPVKVRSRAILDFARGQDCTIRLPGVCCHNPETVVACHLPGHAKGIGSKESDLHIAFGCDRCHAVCDGRARSNLSPAIILDAMLRGLSETQALLVQAGLVTITED